MRPVLWNIVIPAGWAKPGALVAVLAVAFVRAWALRRRARQEGDAVTWGAALWDDRLALAVLLLGLGFAWRGGYLETEISLPLHSYGVAIAVGFVVAIALAQREARRVGQDPERIGDLAFWVILSSLLGSHLYFAAVNWRDYFGPDTWLASAPGASKAIAIATLGLVHVERVPRILIPGGLVFYGGFIAAALTALVYLRRHRVRFLPYADTAIPSVAIGHFFGRLGCFGAGCCWGDVAQAHLPWLARFPPGSLAYQTFAGRPDAMKLLEPNRLSTLPLHPTQIYEALGELAIFAVLVFIVRPRKRFDGQLLACWLLLYAILRSGVELFRGDLERGVYAGLGVGQWTSMAIFAAGVSLWVAGRRLAARGGASGDCLRTGLGDIGVGPRR